MLEALAAATPDHLCLCDPEGRFRFVNQAFCDAVGVSAEHAQGKTGAEMGLPLDLIEVLEAERRRAMRAGQTAQGTLRLTSAVQPRDMEYTISPVLDSDGRPYGAVVNIRDITERAVADEALREAGRQLERRVEKRTAELVSLNETLKQTERALKTANLGRRSLVRATDESQLIGEVCSAAVDAGGYRMAWVGVVDHDDECLVRPIANAGFENGYLTTIRISWNAEDPRGNGPVGRAVRSGTAQVVRDVLTDPTFIWREHALARGFRSVACLPLIDRDENAFGVFAIYASEPDAFDERELDLLQGLAEDLSYGIEGLRERQRTQAVEQSLVESYAALNGMTHDVVEAMGRIVEARDPYTQGHEQRVAQLVRLIAEEMGLDEVDITSIEMAALLHDIGKLRIPAEILTKPGALSTAEFNLIKEHPLQGYEILRGIAFPWPIADIVAQHHERIDGSGYPAALKGDEISLAARILSVADVLEAMASHRPYRSSLGLICAMNELKEQSDAYDAEVVDACNRLYVANRLPL